MIFCCSNWNIMVLRVPLIIGSVAVCRTDSSILNMGHTCPKYWKSRQGFLNVLSLDPCSSLSIWTTFMPYQIHFKQYCMQMTQRLRLLSVHLPVWWLVYKKYLVIFRLSYLISICGWQWIVYKKYLVIFRLSYLTYICGWQWIDFLSILIKQSIWFFILLVAKWTIFL